MSIINEALKKAQRVHATPASSMSVSVSSVPLKTEFRDSLLGKKAPFNWGPAFVLLVLLLIVGPILAPVFSAPFKMAIASSPAPAPTSLAVVGDAAPALTPMPAIAATQSELQQPFSQPGAIIHSPAMHPQFAIEEAPTPPAMLQAFSTANRRDFSLSGIVFSEKESFCLINGRVLKLGETIDGAAIVKITKDQVTLNSNGEKILLSTGT